MQYHSIDTFMQDRFPVLPVPKYGTFEELDREGHRYLLASNGLWVEVRTAWLYFRQRTGGSGVPIPYGTLTAEIRFLCPPIPKTLVGAFAQASRVASPNEIAGQIIWNRTTNDYRLQLLEHTSNGPAHIDYLMPEYGVDELMVVDLHSHGCFDASFSGKDDRDDAAQIKVAGVIGRCAQPVQQIKTRLCVLGMYSALPAPIFDTQELDHGTPA